MPLQLAGAGIELNVKETTVRCYFKNLLLGFFLVSFSLILTPGCRSTPPGDHQAELSRYWDWGSHTIPFTLSYPGAERVPVVAVELNGQTYHFLWDTGYTKSTMFKSGIEKYFGSLESWAEYTLPTYIQLLEAQGEFVPEELSPKEEKLLAKQLTKEAKDWNSRYSFTVTITIAEHDGSGAVVQSQDFPFKVSCTDSPVFKVLDGIVGMDIMETFGKVTFDYQQKIILLGGKEIEGRELFAERHGGTFLVPIITNGMEEQATVDTGAADFIVPANWQKKIATATSPKQEMQELFDQGQSKGYNYKFSMEKTISSDNHQIHIAGLQYTGIRPYKVSNPFIKATPSTKVSLERPLLGYPFWKDRIIQLDFESNIFRIR